MRTRPQRQRAAPGATVPATRSLSRTLSSDARFDSFYDEKVRELSAWHWTPVRIAARAARLLTETGARRILDVGSGVGKFCIVGALSTSADFVGVERRKRLVEIARSAASHYGADRATFVQADIDAFSFEGFSGIYLYHPVYEQISNVVRQIDGTTERSWAAYRHFVDTTTAKLAALSPPVVVVTFDGFGGAMPAAYALKEVESAWYDRLELWIKV